MPIPKRRGDEDRDDFLSRCMSDPKMNEEYPDKGQRFAVCQTSSKSSVADRISDAHYENTYGSTEIILDESEVYIPHESEYLDFGEDGEEHTFANKPGLWENIRKKKEREGDDYKPAKPGDPDRPDPESWKKAKNEKDFKPHTMYDKDGNPHEAKTYEDHLRMKKMGYTHTKAEYKYEDPKTGEIFTYRRKGLYKKDGRVLKLVKASEYQGKKVTLNKPFRTPKGPKKFSVYVKNDKGNVVKVNFGDPNMEIKRDDPARRKSFRARHKCDTNPGPKWKAKYWSCKFWSSKKNPV